MSKKLRKKHKKKQYVKVIDPGKTYSSYDEMAQEMKLKNWDRSYLPKKTKIYLIVAGPIEHPDDKKAILYGIKDLDINKEYIINTNGIEFIGTNKNVFPRKTGNSS